MNQSTFDVLERIQIAINKVTPKQRKLAEYILHNYKKAAFLNSTDLAKAANVSGSTVVRFAETLEYTGFPEMQAALHSLIQLEINTVEMFSDSNEPKNESSCEKEFRQASEHLIKISKEISKTAFDESLSLIEKQKNILIVGHQASACLAEYTSYALGKIRPNVHKLAVWDEGTFNTLNEYSDRDLAILFAFPRFPRQTYKIAKYLYEKNIPILFITSRGTNPLSGFSTVTLPINIKYASFIDDLAPVIYLVKSLISTVAQNNRKQTTVQLEKFEHFVDSTNLFCK